VRALLRLLALLAWPAVAAAQGPPAPGLPARLVVTGVAAGDALNLRAAPSTTAPVVGTLAPGVRAEVVARSPDGRWGLVARNEGGAWAALRFLAPEGAAGGPLPRPLLCRGTEPFWSLELRADGATLATPEAARELRLLAEAEDATGVVAALGDEAGGGGEGGEGGGGPLALSVLRAACSDGMSDRPYGLAVLLWDRGDGLLDGCCALAPD
jgi:uncharacterized membrane protein